MDPVTLLSPKRRCPPLQSGAVSPSARPPEQACYWPATTMRLRFHGWKHCLRCVDSYTAAHQNWPVLRPYLPLAVEFFLLNLRSTSPAPQTPPVFAQNTQRHNSAQFSNHNNCHQNNTASSGFRYVLEGNVPLQGTCVPPYEFGDRTAAPGQKVRLANRRPPTQQESNCDGYSNALESLSIASLNLPRKQTGILLICNRKTT